MAESVQSGLIKAGQVAREAIVRKAPNGVSYAAYGDNNLPGQELERMVQAVPVSIAGALGRKTYFFVPLALSDRRTTDPSGQRNSDATVIAPVYSAEFGDQAICHRNVTLGDTDGIFISTRLLGTFAHSKEARAAVRLARESCAAGNSARRVPVRLRRSPASPQADGSPKPPPRWVMARTL